MSEAPERRRRGADDSAEIDLEAGRPVADAKCANGADAWIEPDAEVLANGADADGRADDSPWPIETWGPLYPEHFDLRTIADLAKLPSSGEGRA